MLSRFHLNVTDGWTDRRTDGQICYINIAHQHTALLTRDKTSHLAEATFIVRKLYKDISYTISLRFYYYIL